jgi:hypothetical protein
MGPGTFGNQIVTYDTSKSNTEVIAASGIWLGINNISSKNGLLCVGAIAETMMMHGLGDSGLVPIILKRQLEAGQKWANKTRREARFFTLASKEIFGDMLVEKHGFKPAYSLVPTLPPSSEIADTLYGKVRVLLIGFTPAGFEPRLA